MLTNKNQSATQPLAIIGIGCLFPKANNPQEYWANIQAGVDAISAVPSSHWRADDYFDEDKTIPDKTYAKRGGFIEPQDFEPLQYGLNPNNIEATDTTQLLGMVVARQALLDAGYAIDKNTKDGRQFNRDRTSVIMGVTGTLELVIPLGARLGHPIWRKALVEAGIDSKTADDVIKRIADSYVAWQENSFPGLLGNVVAGRIANRFDLGGTNCVVDAACASSLSAIHLAALELTTQRADMVITGGMDTFNDIFMYMCFSKTPALSPSGDSRPFAKDGDGTILGEGLGTIILKRLDDAQRDGDKIYAILRGIGSSSDGRGNSIYAPSTAGQIKALQNAYQHANVNPRSIELIETHGTGTAVGDTVEAEALAKVYQQHSSAKSWCAVGSVKSMIGHTKAAAGIAGIIKVALALQKKVLPPSIKVANPLELVTPGVSPLYLNASKRPWFKSQATPRRAAVSSFGFGGSNFHCVLEEHEATTTTIDWDGTVLIIALSAASKAALIKKLPDEKILESWQQLRAFAYKSCQSFKHDAKQRLTIVIQRSQTDLIQLIAAIKQQLSGTDAASTTLLSQLQKGVYYSTKNTAHNIAFVFPGQGSQYINMGCDLACQFPDFFSAIATANQLFLEQSKQQSLVDLLYPVPAFSESAKKAQQTALRSTQHAQIAIGAVSMGVLNVLDYFAVKANVTMGHSYGELSALAAAGYYDINTLYRLSYLRGQLMAAGSGDRGAMLAVIATYEKVVNSLKEHHIELVIANHNSPQQIVLSGATKEIDRFVALAKTDAQLKKIRMVKLPVAAAFHSSFVAAAVKPFASALNKCKFLDKQLPVLANTTANYYPNQKSKIVTLLAEQLVNPVRFVEQIERLYADGINAFIEVGPGRVLTDLIKKTLKDKSFIALAVDSSSGKQSGQHDLALVLATLAAAGNPVNLTKWDTAGKPVKKPAHHLKPVMTVKISGANYIKPRPARPPLPSAAIKSNGVTSNNQHDNTAEDTAAMQPAAELLKLTQENIVSLQKMQQHTAHLQKQYLEGQDLAQQTIQSLLQQQQQLLTGQAITAREQAATINNAQGLTTPVTIPEEITTAAPPSPAHALDQLLLSIVAEKTGYPDDMLSLDMNLDTDLGIDSIKRVEILAALQEKYPELPAVDPSAMTDLKTLQSIVELFRTTVTNNDTDIRPLANSSAAQPNPAHALDQLLLSIVAEKTGYPDDMLSLDMNLDTDLGIDSIKRVEILAALQEKYPHLPPIAADNLAHLKTLQQIVAALTVNIAPQQTHTEKLAAISAASDQDTMIYRYTVTLSEIQSSGSDAAPLLNKEKDIWINKDGGKLAQQLKASLLADGYKVHLVNNDAQPYQGLGGIIICTKPTADKKWLLDTFLLIQRCGAILNAANGFLLALTTLGGTFGFDKVLTGNPLQAGIYGIIKTARQEWQHTYCKAIDIDLKTTTIDAIKTECSITGPVEVGLHHQQRVQLSLAAAPLAKPTKPKLLNNSDCIVISGGARGVAAEIAVALAKAYQCSLLLLGRSPEYQPEPDWLTTLTEPAAIKKAIVDHVATQLKPNELEQRYRAVIANRSINTNLKRMQQYSAHVKYVSVDIRDAAAVARAIDAARAEFGNISGLIHAAGILADSLIQDKTVSQFDAVYATKVVGLENLLTATNKDPLKLINLFSSTTARFGRKGQVDYAAANEVLNKMAVQVANKRKQGKVSSINWGPWNGGMVTPALKQLFKKEGVIPIELQAGADCFIKEIEADGPVETVILGHTKNIPLVPSRPQTEVEYTSPILVFERQLAIHSHPFLSSHVIDNYAVFPIAVMIEWFAHAALHANIGMQFHGFNDLKVFKGIRIKANEKIQLQFFAGQLIQEANNNLVPVRLYAGEQLHASAVVVLVDSYQQNISPVLAPIVGQYQQDNYYQDGRLFHGKHLQGITKVTHCDESGIAATVNAAPAPKVWMEKPIRSNWLADPLVLDSAFQSMILWSFAQNNTGSLPTAIAYYRQYQRRYPKASINVIAAINTQTNQHANAKIEFINNGQLIAAIDGYECVRDSTLQAAFKKNDLSLKD